MTPGQSGRPGAMHPMAFASGKSSARPASSSIRMSITIPAYNEEVTLEEVVTEALEAAAALFEDFEVLLVNDGSLDGTGEIANRLAQEDQRIRVIHHPQNLGFSGAMMSCVRHAAGDYVFMGPADGQVNYGDLGRFLEITDRYDLIFGSRVFRKDGTHRKLASAIWYAFIRILFGARIPEFSSLFCFRRDAIPEFPVQVRPDASNFMPMLYLTAVRSGARVGTLGVDQGPRRGGEPKGGNFVNAVRTIAEDFKLAWQLRGPSSR